MNPITFYFHKMAKESLHLIGGEIVKQAKKNMDQKSVGRTYIIGGKTHIASKDGDTANNQTGKLKQSIRYELNGLKMKFGAGNSSIDYAGYLEEGTSKMGKRPNCDKSINQKETVINAEIDKIYKKAVGYDRRN